MQIVNKFLLSLIGLLFIASCHRKGCTDQAAENYSEKAKKDDGSCIYPPQGEVTINFSHFFDGAQVTSSVFNQLNYQNENGEVLSISKLIYHISDVRFYKTNGDSVVVDGYHLVDISLASTLNYILPQEVIYDTYNAIGFNLGFVQTENTSGAYSDLNAANWSWPESLGGGYHQLQLEGKFIETSSDTTNYALHSGSTVRELIGAESVFHTNYIWYKIPVLEFSLIHPATVELKMNVSEWFKNPNLWDLNLQNNGLMGDYNAQLKIRANGADVFEVGAIIQ